MQSSQIRRFIHKDNSAAVMFVGYDKDGRLVSHLEKNGLTIATDLFLRMPLQTYLDKHGWIRE